MTALPPELRARILGAIKEEPAPTRASFARTSALVLAGAAVAVTALVLKTGGYIAGGRPSSYVLVGTLGWTAMAIIATWGSLSRGSSMLGRPSAWLKAVAVLGAPLLGAWMLLASVGWPETRELGCPPGADFGCLAMTVAMAAGPFAAFLFVRRRSDPVHPRATGAALGVAAGCWGAVAINVHCACATPMHMILGHVVPVVVLSGLGALLGKTVLGLKSTPRQPRV